MNKHTEKAPNQSVRKQSLLWLRRTPVKTLSAVAGVLAVAVIILVLATSPGDKTSAAGEDPMPADNTISENSPAATVMPEARVSLAMPAYAPVSISVGTQAAVVADIQARLSELYYLDADQPGTEYEETTQTAVIHFQAQNGLEATGTVDQQTYDRLLSEQAKEYAVSLEAEGEDVSDLQQRLYELGYMEEATGYFGAETEAAVMKFQMLNDLPENGAIDQQTREMLYAPDAVPNMYSYGEQCAEIEACQQRLKELGYLTTVPDGKFGEDTKAAVRRFQESNGLIVDGNIGPTTQGILMSSDAQGNALAIGAEGDDVMRVQERLKKLGYMYKATGYYGELTDAAVRSFQAANGLSADGKVGSQTMNLLTSAKAKKYQAPAVSRGEQGSEAAAPDTSAPAANVTGANVESLIAVAESKLGCKYVRTAKGPNTFDCSGFVYWCLKQVGVNQGYMTSGGWAACTKYTRINSMGDMQRGDIIAFNGHVAIYAGNGTIIDASSSNGGVVRRGCTSPWFSRNFICAFRVF